MASMGSATGQISASTINSLSEKDRREIEQFLQNEAQKEKIQDNIHSLTQNCFKKCITSKISAGQLDRYEEPCMQNCVSRFMDAHISVLRQLERIQKGE